jgi:alginate O-acetyltransferase complex protein AlgI
MGVATLFSFLVAFKFGERIQAGVFEKNYNIKRLMLMSILGAFLLLFSIGSITSSGFNPFIYFRF